MTHPWSSYEIFSILSGLCCAAILFLPANKLGPQNSKVRDRLWYLGGAVGFTWYGFYVHGQNSGTFTFPFIIFLIPPGLIGYALFQFYGSSNGMATAAKGDSTAQGRKPTTSSDSRLGETLCQCVHPIVVDKFCERCNRDVDPAMAEIFERAKDSGTYANSQTPSFRCVKCAAPVSGDFCPKCDAG